MIYKILLAFVTGLSVGATVTYFVVMWRLDGVCGVLGMAVEETGCYNSTEQVIKSNIESAEIARGLKTINDQCPSCKLRESYECGGLGFPFPCSSYIKDEGADCTKCELTQTGELRCAHASDEPKPCNSFFPIDEVPEPEPDYPLDLGVKATIPTYISEDAPGYQCPSCTLRNDCSLTINDFILCPSYVKEADNG